MRGSARGGVDLGWKVTTSRKGDTRMSTIGCRMWYPPLNETARGARIVGRALSGAGDLGWKVTTSRKGDTRMSTISCRKWYPSLGETTRGARIVARVASGAGDLRRKSGQIRGGAHSEVND